MANALWWSTGRSRPSGTATSCLSPFGGRSAGVITMIVVELRATDGRCDPARELNPGELAGVGGGGSSQRSLNEGMAVRPEPSVLRAGVALVGGNVLDLTSTWKLPEIPKQLRARPADSTIRRSSGPILSGVGRRRHRQGQGRRCNPADHHGSLRWHGISPFRRGAGARPRPHPRTQRSTRVNRGPAVSRRQAAFGPLEGEKRGDLRGPFSCGHYAGRTRR